MNENKNCAISEDVMPLNNRTFSNIDSILNHTNAILDINHKFCEATKEELNGLIKIVGACANLMLGLFFIFLFGALFIL